MNISSNSPKIVERRLTGAPLSPTPLHNYPHFNELFHEMQAFLEIGYFSNEIVRFLGKICLFKVKI